MSNRNYEDMEGLGYLPTNASQGNSSLPVVADPEAAYTQITRGEFQDYIKNFRGMENDLIKRAQTDTSLVDQARLDSTSASDLTKQIASRNQQRYGGQMTPAQLQAMRGSIQRGSILGQIQSVGDARIAQNEANTNLKADLINIGQGVNRSSQSQLGSAATDANSRRQAFDAAKAQSRANTYSTIGQLGSMAIFALSF
jgi:hypothetical protein